MLLSGAYCRSAKVMVIGSKGRARPLPVACSSMASSLRRRQQMARWFAMRLSIGDARQFLPLSIGDRPPNATLPAWLGVTD